VLCAFVLYALVCICSGQIVHVNDTLIRQLSDAVARPKQVYYHSAHKKKVPADADGTKYMALTFDDGPHQTLTPRLLDILKEKKAKATFYVMGVKVAIHPEIVARAALEGHEIGNHVYDHPVLTKIKPQVRHSVSTCVGSACV
jgi:peptidoglycan/xylan/chitin deacetylase (PgdA/CDA1 family)